MKPGREGLDVGHEVSPLLPCERLPRRHVGVVNTPAYGVVQVAVSRETSAGSRSALECGLGKVARLRIKIRSIFSGTVAAHPVTSNAVAPV
jgi:hypothetical protein